jgi:hypothetical protein
VRDIVGWCGSLLIALVSEVCRRQVDGDGGLSGEYAEKFATRPSWSAGFRIESALGRLMTGAGGRNGHMRGGQHGGASSNRRQRCRLRSASDGPAARFG